MDMTVMQCSLCQRGDPCAHAKPLHVQVAEALGWPEAVFIGNEGHDPTRPILGWLECHLEHDPADDCEHDHVWHLGEKKFFPAPRYDTDWSATGPLIERFKLEVKPSEHQAGRWQAVHVSGQSHVDRAVVDGYETPLLAVCRLLLFLSTDPYFKAKGLSLNG